MVFSAAENSILTNIAFQQFLIRHCDVREMLILMGKFDGKTDQAIADEFSCSRRYICKLLKSLRYKFLLFFGSQ